MRRRSPQWRRRPATRLPRCRRHAPLHHTACPQRTWYVWQRPCTPPVMGRAAPTACTWRMPGDRTADATLHRAPLPPGSWWQLVDYNRTGMRTYAVHMLHGPLGCRALDLAPRPRDRIRRAALHAQGSHQPSLHRCFQPWAVLRSVWRNKLPTTKNRGVNVRLTPHTPTCSGTTSSHHCDTPHASTARRCPRKHAAFRTTSAHHNTRALILPGTPAYSHFEIE